MDEELIPTDPLPATARSLYEQTCRLDTWTRKQFLKGVKVENPRLHELVMAEYTRVYADQSSRSTKSLRSAE